MTSSEERKCIICEFSAPVSDWKVWQKDIHSIYDVTSVDVCSVRCAIILVECVHGDMKRTACLVSGVRHVLMEPLKNARDATFQDRCENGNLTRMVLLPSGARNAAIGLERNRRIFGMINEKTIQMKITN